jgi:hypothetical protein
LNTPTMVRNTTKGPTVFSADGQNVEWAGAGDVMGNDLQPVPASFLENVQFHRMAARGIFKIETGDQEIEATLALHRQDYEQRMRRQQNASIDALDMTPGDDSLMLECVGPSANGHGACGMSVPMKANKQSEQPPLCPQHAELAGQYVAQEVDGKVIGGRSQVTWVPIKLGATERQNR